MTNAMNLDMNLLHRLRIQIDVRHSLSEAENCSLFGKFKRATYYETIAPGGLT